MDSNENRDMDRALARIAERSRRAVADFLDRQSRDANLSDVFDPLHIGDAFLQMTTQILTSPVRLVEAQMSLWSSYLNLWQQTARSMMGDPDGPVPGAERWDEAELFSFVKQSYLMATRWMHTLLLSGAGLDAGELRKLDLYSLQMVEAMNPADFFAANRDLLERTIEQEGDNLVKGLDRMLVEFDRIKESLSLRTVPPPPPGRPAEVVFANRSIEVRRFAPAVIEAHEVPLLIVPPWNAGHHLLDLAPSRSLIEWALEQGHSVFALSWLPPEGELAERDFAETLTEGPLAAVEAVSRLTGQKRVNGLGFGLGGTLLAAALGILASRGEDRFASATFLAAPIDFNAYANRETRPQPTRAALDLLRANDLIWSYVIDSFLDAANPLPFDLLRDTDSLNLATAMQDFYVQGLYQRNLLAEPGGIILQGTPIDLSAVTAPAYVVAGREDHIVPWRSTFAATLLLSGPVRFVLSPSGHAGAIVNPPGPRARFFWSNGRRAKDAEFWLENATRQKGSWWEDWTAWLAPLSGAKKPIHPGP